jgi:hypothetical protein
MNKRPSKAHLRGRCWRGLFISAATRRSESGRSLQTETEPAEVPRELSGNRLKATADRGSQARYDPPEEPLSRRRIYENRVRCFRMKNITLSADEDLIERARSIARGQRRTPNAAFQEWLVQFTQSAGDAQGYDGLMSAKLHIDAGRRFDRDELNER